MQTYFPQGIVGILITTVDVDMVIHVVCTQNFPKNLQFLPPGVRIASFLENFAYVRK